MRTAKRCALLGLLLLSSAWLAADAAQWVVALDGSGAFRSIQGAIDAASYGDVVYVSPGTYEEHVALKDGVRVLGAGASSTSIRYAYGFDEVVRAVNMGGGSLERVTIERLASVLPGPAVRVESAAAALIDCVVSGGQGAGIEVIGPVASLLLEGVDILDNAGHGVHVHDGGTVSLERCRIETNASSGLVVGTSSSADVRDGEIARNGRSGVVVEGSGTLYLARAAIRGHSDWGLVALGACALRLETADLADNAKGGVQIAGTSQAVLHGVATRGGAAGVQFGGAASITASELRVADAVADAVTAVGSARLDAVRLEVRAAGGAGVVLDTSSEVRLVSSTVIDCGGDGISIRAGSPEVRQTIVAYNQGAGIRLDASRVPPPTADLAYNNVWDNGQDYVGTARPATDTVAAPELASLGGELVLLPTSPCLETGEAWGTIGSAATIEASRALSVDLEPRIAGWLGATWTSTLRVSGLPLQVDRLALGCEWGGDSAYVDVEAALLGAWGASVAAAASGTVSWERDEAGRATLGYGLEGALSGGRPWATAWLTAELAGAGPYASGRLALAWPGVAWTSDASLGFAGPVSLSLSIGWGDLTLRSLSGSLGARIPAAGAALSLTASAAVLPVLAAGLEASWSDVWTLRADYRPTEEAWRASLSLGDAAARVEASVRFVSGDFADAAASIALRGRLVGAHANLSLGPTGPRVGAGISVAVPGLRSAPQNVPPTPAFRTTPPDPEVGKPIRFLADESEDPDGELREIWWDFGDGAAAEGVAADHAYATPGTYQVVLTVSDDDDAVATLAQSVRVWPADTAPRAAFAAYPVSESGVRLPRGLREGDRVLLDAGDSTDLDGAIVEYSWDVGADGEFELTTADSVATVGPLDAGSHPVTLRAIDDSGRSTAVMRVVVVARSAPPLAQFSFSPPTPALRDPVYFSDRSADADGAVVLREWDFGDGTSSRDASPVHRYERVGRYAVTLRVTDDSGLTAEVKQALDVAAVPEIVEISDVWALAIGVSNYEEVKDLQYAADDAVAMVDLFLGAGVPADHVRLLLDRDGPQPDLNDLEARRATLVNVREALGWLRRVAKPNDLVVIHFSGHGLQGADDDGDERDGVDEFFVLWDTRNAAKEDTALRDDEFGAALDRIESDHVVVFFDGCYSGGLSRSLPSSARPATDKADLFSDFSVEGRLVFAASSEAQDAFESDDFGHGIFTHFVLDGLAGAADAGGDGRVTAWELYEFLAGRVPERALVEHGTRQDPQLLGEGDVRVLLAQAARPPEADFTYGPGRPYAGGAVTFVDQSTGSRRIADREWTFGDGAKSAEESPTHSYAEPGEYTVELRVTQDGGAESATTRTVSVGDAGKVLSLDAESGLAVLSLGREHGVAVGDRFAAGGTPSVLEVAELLESETSAARVISGPPPAPGAALRPLPTS